MTEADHGQSTAGRSRTDQRRDGSGAEPVADPGRPARLRDVFPWWYLAGAVVSLAVLAVLDTDGAAAVAMWGAPLGILIRERRQTARRLLGEGRPVDRAALTAPRGAELLTAVALTGVSIGLGLVLGTLVGDDPGVQAVAGVVVLGASVAFVAALWAVGRARRRP